MCQSKELSAAENGQKEQDIRLEVRNDLSSRVRAKGLNMDEAISETKFGFFNCFLIFTSGWMMSAMLIEKIGITFVFPVSHCDLNLTTSQKGILGSVGFFGIICSSHLWGFLADTKGRRRVIQPTLLIASCMSITSSFVQSFYLLAALRFLNGFFISASSATVYVYLSEFHNNKQRGRAIMGAQILSGLICMLLPVVAYLVINQEWHFDIPLIGITYRPWRLFLVLCSFPALFTYVLLLFLPESPKYVLGQGKQADTFEILQTVNRINNGKNAILPRFEIYEEKESIENRQRMVSSKNNEYPLLTCIWNQTAPLIKPPYLLTTILICIIQFSIFYTSQGLNVFYAEILNKMGTKSDDDRMMLCDIINMEETPSNKTLNLVMDGVCNTKIQTTTLEQGVILQAIFTGGALIITFIIDMIPKFPIIFSILAGTGACGIAIMMTDIPFVQIGLLTMLMASGIGSNVLNTATVELYPTALRAMAICISLMFGRLGSITGSNTAAFLLENYCTTAFYLSGSILIAAGALTFFIPKIHERVSKSGKPK